MGRFLPPSTEYNYNRRFRRYSSENITAEKSQKNRFRLSSVLSRRLYFHGDLRKCKERHGHTHMDNNTKKRVPLDIAGTPLTIVTDEPEEFVKLLAAQLDRRISALTKNSFRISQLDAALLCALDAMGDKFKSEKRIRTLEAQAQVYEVEIENLRAEIDALKAAAGTPEVERVMQETETISSRLRDSSDTTAEDKVHALERYLESKKSSDAKPSSAHTREEKIRYIESLLRGNELSTDNK